MSRLSPGILTLGIVLILAALGGAYALKVYMQPQPQAEAPRPNPVPVASIELPVGRQIRLGDIAMMPRRAVKDMPANTMVSTRDIIGRTLRVAMKPGETFTTVNLYPQGEGPSLSERLKPGYRAVTVPVGNFDAVAGYVRPGVLVDVLFRSQPRAARQGFDNIPEKTVTLAGRVEVLAVGKNPVVQQASRSSRFASQETSVLVTLACLPREANKLRAIEGRGDIALALWAEQDTQQPVSLPEPAQQPVAVPQSKDEGVTLEQILGVGPSKAFTTEIFRGGSRAVNRFENGTIVEQQSAGNNYTWQGHPGPDKQTVTIAAPAQPQDNNTSIINGRPAAHAVK